MTILLNGKIEMRQIRETQVKEIIYAEIWFYITTGN